jgi:peptidoglycan/xylan/chitin deacetylase (PgdA/CDA1 family)
MPTSRRCRLRLHEQRGGNSLWPEGRPFAICLTHDVDLIAEQVTPGQALRSMRLSLLGSDGRMRFARPPVRFARAVHHGISRWPSADALERCVELERERRIPATYFFTAYPGNDGHRYDCTYDFGDACRFAGERVTVADVVRTLDREGFEVGLHGSYNSALVPGRLSAERAALEGATGLALTSTRQHFLHWEIQTTPRLQSEAGLSVDSTLGFNRNVGFRAGTSLPFRWPELELVELPPLLQEGALLRRDALELGLDLAWKTLRGLLDRVADVGGVATLVFHPNTLGDGDSLALFKCAIEYGVERGGWFATVRELAAWFRRVGS